VVGVTGVTVVVEVVDVVPLTVLSPPTGPPFAPRAVTTATVVARIVAKKTITAATPVDVAIVRPNTFMTRRCLASPVRDLASGLA
jgi:hypothetical protein